MGRTDRIVGDSPNRRGGNNGAIFRRRPHNEGRFAILGKNHHIVARYPNVRDFLDGHCGYLPPASEDDPLVGHIENAHVTDGFACLSDRLPRVSAHAVINPPRDSKAYPLAATNVARPLASDDVSDVWLNEAAVLTPLKNYA